MKEFTSLSKDELFFISQNSIELKKAILDSNGEILAMMDNYDISYSMDFLIDKDIFILALPYVHKHESKLSKEQLDLFVYYKCMLGKNLVSKKIENMKELDIFNVFVSNMTLINKNKKETNLEIKKLISETTIDLIALSNYLELKKYSKDMSFFDDKTSLVLLAKSWKVLSNNDKNFLISKSPKLAVFAMILTNEMPKSDIVYKTIIDSIIDIEFSGKVREKVLNYLYDLEIEKKGDLSLINIILDSWTKNQSNSNKIEEEKYKYLKNSNFSKRLDDFNFFISMKYDFFDSLEEKKGMAKNILQESMSYPQSLGLFLSVTNLNMGMALVFKQWHKINPSTAYFDSVLDDNLINTLKSAYYELLNPIKVYGTLLNIFKNSEDFLFYYKFVNASLEQTKREIDSGLFDLKDSKYPISIISEFITLVAKDNQVLAMDHLKFQVEKTIENIVVTLKKIEEKLGTEFNNIIYWEHTDQMKLFLAGFINEYEIKTVIPNFETVLSTTLNGGEIYNLDMLFLDSDKISKKLTDIMFNTSKTMAVKDSESPSLERLREIHNKDGTDYDNESLFIFKNQNKTGVKFLNLLTKNKIPLRSSIIEKILDNLSTKSVDAIKSIEEHLDMINKHYPEKITTKIIFQVINFNSRDDNISKLLMSREDEMTKISNDYLFKDKNSSFLRLSSTFNKKMENQYLIEKDYEKLLYLRNACIRNSFMLTREIFSNYDFNLLKEIIMDDDRFLIYINPLLNDDSLNDDSLNNIKRIIKLESDQDLDLLKWVNNFFKRHPEKQKKIPLEFEIFNLNYVNNKKIFKFLTKSYPQEIFDGQIMINNDDQSENDFVLILKEAFKKGIANDFLDSNKYMEKYLDTVYEDKKFNDILNNFEKPQEYANIVIMANRAILCKTNFYSQYLDVDKFFDGISIILNNSTPQNFRKNLDYASDSFLTVISLSNENKYKIINQYSKLGLDITDNTFYQIDNYLDTLSNSDIKKFTIQCFNNGRNGANFSLLINKYIERGISENDEILYKIKNLVNQKNIFKSIEQLVYVFSLNNLSNPTLNELEKTYNQKKLNLNDETINNLDLLLTDLYLKKEIPINNDKKVKSLKF